MTVSDLVPKFLASRTRPSGFTLLEVIIAFVILALVLGAVFNTFSIGLRNANLAGDYARAVVHAEAKLGLLGVAEPLELSVTSGRFDRLYGWRQSIRPIAPPDDSAANLRESQLHELPNIVRLSGSEHEVVRVRLPQDAPHALHIVFRMAPIATRRQIAEV